MKVVQRLVRQSPDLFLCSWRNNIIYLLLFLGCIIHSILACCVYTCTAVHVFHSAHTCTCMHTASMYIIRLTHIAVLPNNGLHLTRLFLPTETHHTKYVALSTHSLYNYAFKPPRASEVLLFSIDCLFALLKFPCSLACSVACTLPTVTGRCRIVAVTMLVPSQWFYLD